MKEEEEEGRTGFSPPDSSSCFNGLSRESRNSDGRRAKVDGRKAFWVRWHFSITGREQGSTSCFIIAGGSEDMSVLEQLMNTQINFPSGYKTWVFPR